MSSGLTAALSHCTPLSSIFPFDSCEGIKSQNKGCASRSAQLGFVVFFDRGQKEGEAFPMINLNWALNRKESSFLGVCKASVADAGVNADVTRALTTQLSRPLSH